MRSHLAILKSPYLDLIISGEKTLECRLCRIACPPFQCASPGETVYLKQSAGPIKARAHIKKVLFYDNLTPARIRGIARRYQDKIRALPDFYHTRLDCRYGSLIWLTNVQKISPYRIRRKGLRAWIVSPNDDFGPASP